MEAFAVINAILQLSCIASSRIARARLLSFQRLCNGICHRLARSAQRIGTEMGIALRRSSILVAEKRANDGKARASGDRNAGKAVPQVVNTDIFQAC